jgi:hypothetical protein
MAFSDQIYFPSADFCKITVMKNLSLGPDTNPDLDYFLIHQSRDPDPVKQDLKL